MISSPALPLAANGRISRVLGQMWHIAAARELQSTKRKNPTDIQMSRLLNGFIATIATQIQSLIKVKLPADYLFLQICVDIRQSEEIVGNLYNINQL